VVQKMLMHLRPLMHLMQMNKRCENGETMERSKIMMSKSWVQVVVIMLACPIIAIPAGAVENETAQKSPAWSKKMRGLYETLSRLMVDVSSDQEFNAPKNRKRIEDDAKKLSELAHEIDSGKLKSPDPDPSVSMISSLFSKEADHAYRELKRGRREYARGVLKTIGGYCIACHTRSDSGPQFSSLPVKAPFSAFTTMEKAQFFAASRQYDLALTEFERIVADPQASRERQIEWERAVRYSLAIAVRVKKDPEKALSILERVLGSPGVPEFFREDALEWQKSVKEWKGELTRSPKTEEGLFAEAARLLGQARSAQKYPADRSADINYLRTTAVVHDLMSQFPKSKHIPQAFLIAGACYETLRDLEIWSLHDLYFESCIRKAPHTDVAQACYKRYEESTFAEYSGSGGMFLPSDERERLAQLRALALPEGPAASPLQ